MDNVSVAQPMQFEPIPIVTPVLPNVSSYELPLGYCCPEPPDPEGLNLNRLRLSSRAKRLTCPDLGALVDPEVPLETLYRRISGLGRGVSGSVSLWEDEEGTRYAIKQYVEEECEPDDEFEIGLSLRHPNIGRVHHLVTKRCPENGTMAHYLVKEYVEGRPLADLDLTPSQSFSVVGQMASSLLYAFDRGFAPTDLHLNNVLLTPEGQIKWIDLNLWMPAGEPWFVGAALGEIIVRMEALVKPLSSEDDLRFVPLLEAVMVEQPDPRSLRTYLEDVLLATGQPCSAMRSPFIRWLDRAQAAILDPIIRAVF